MMESTSKSSENPKSGGPTPVVRLVVSNAKFDVEKFDGQNNFGMWQCELGTTRTRCDSEDKPEKMLKVDWKKLNRQACETIRLCLANDQKYFVMKESMAKELWNKLEDKYMTKGIETIRLCLANDQKYFVMKESMAKELWNKLEDKYMTKGIENKLYLKRRFFGFRYVEGTSMP
jgi:hypothetical protein